MPLTDIKIRKAEQRDKEYKLADGGGLYILIRPNGSKLWKMKLRIHGREQKLSFGRYPEISLKEARARRDEAKLEMARGGDPVRRRRQEKLTANLQAGDRFEDIAIEFIEKCEAEDQAPATTKKKRYYLHLLAPIGKLPVAEITPQEMLAALRKIEKRGLREAAKRARQFASQVFRYAVASARATIDPAAPLKGALTSPVAKHHAAILDPTRLGALLRAIDGYDGSPVTKIALQIAPHVFVRPGELRHAEWTEINLKKAEWRIPAGKMKSRRAHAVPLSRQVVTYFYQLSDIRGGEGYVFNALNARKRPMSENTINAAFRRMGFTKEEVTAHGLRATASTLLNESGRWHPDAIERALAHGISGNVRNTYHRGDHWEERVRMAQWWSDYLDGLKAVPRD